MLLPVLDGRLDFPHGHPMPAGLGCAGQQRIWRYFTFLDSNEQVLLADRTNPLAAVKKTSVPQKIPVC